MRLLLLLLFVAAGVAKSADPEDLYVKFFEKIIRQIERMVERTEYPSQKDKERIECIYGMNAFLRHIGSSWAISMIDAATKLQSGLLGGNLIDLGQYDECAGVRVRPEDMGHVGGPSFSGQHCLVSMNFHVPNNTIELDGRPKQVRDLFGKDYIPVTMAQCYPSLCRPWVLEEALNAVFSVPDSAFQLFAIKYQLSVSIKQHDCTVQDQVPIDTADWVVAAIVLFILVLVGISTAMDYFYIAVQSRIRQKTVTEEFVISFSLYTNVRKLLDTSVTSDAMTCLNGMKFFSMAWVVVSHRYRYLVNEPLVNLLVFPDELKKMSKMLILSGPLAVDSFFLISGLLNMYTFCIVREKTRRYNLMDVIIGYIHRFFRLTPAYLMMMGLTATWLYRLREGPLWYRFVGTARESCRHNSWANLVYLNNYLYPDDYCMMQSWYLAADMQMFWLSPFVIYPLWRWPIYGFIQLSLLIVASILSPMLVSYFLEIKTPIPITTDPVQTSKEMASLYLPTHTKTISYVLGIGAGYIFYKIKKGKIQFAPTVIVRCIGWLLTAALMLYSVFGGYDLYQFDSAYNRTFSAFFIGFQRFFWSLGLIWIIFTCVLGYGGVINSLLSWKIFIPLGRLTYCVYLTHIAVLLTSIGAAKSTFFFSDFDQVERFLGDLMISLAAAFVLSMVLEAPMMKIEKMIFGGGRPRKNATATSDRPSTSTPPEDHNHQA